MPRFFVRLNCSEPLYYRTFDPETRTHKTLTIHIGSREIGEVEASSYQQAHYKGIRYFVESYLEEHNFDRANDHYGRIGGYHSGIPEETMREGIDIRIGRQWITISSLPRGGIYDRTSSQTRGTKRTQERKKKAIKDNNLFAQLALEFPELREPDDSEKI